MLVGGTGAQRSDEAWHQVYRALEHGQAKNNCNRQEILNKFPGDIVDFANTFVDLQLKRHKADYDPHEKFYKSAVKQDIADAADVMGRFKNVPVKDRRAFAAFVLLKVRP